MQEELEKKICFFRDDFPPLCRRPKCVKWAIVPPKEVIAASCWSRSATKRTELCSHSSGIDKISSCSKNSQLQKMGSVYNF